MASSVLDTGDLPDVLAASQPLQGKWYDLGLALRLDEQPTLEVIENVSGKSPKDALRKVLSEWLKTNPEPTWSLLVKAVAGVLVNEKKVALAVAREHCPELVAELGGGGASRGTGAKAAKGTEELTEDDSFEVTEYLGDLSPEQLYQLAVVMGISVASARRMKGSDECCDQVVTAWLQKVNKVPDQCPPSWQNLEKALRHKRVSQTGVANKIKEEKL